MSFWILLQLKEGLYSNVRGEQVTCLNNGIYTRKMSRSVPREFNDRIFTTFASALYCQVSLLLYCSQRKRGRNNKEKPGSSLRRLNIMQSRFCHSKQITKFLCFSRPFVFLASASLRFSHILGGERKMFNCETASIAQTLYPDFLSLACATKLQVIEKYE